MDTMTIVNLIDGYNSNATSPRKIISRIIDLSKDYADYSIWITPPSWELIDPYLKSIESMSDDEKATKPLWGIPFAIKDNIDLEGVPTTAACPAYSYTPDESATVVQRLIDAGAIPVGKTNLDQFATGLVGTRSAYGECKNALDPELISGGSSSGSAVAVALGLCAFALGTDTAGSGRVPAALNGIVGYKPPLGAWSTTGVVPACASLDCPTVFANTIEDAMLVDSVVEGYDEHCCWSKQIVSKEYNSPRVVYVPDSYPKFYGDWANEYAANWNNTLKTLDSIQKNSSGTENEFGIKSIDTEYFSKIASILYDGPWVAERWADLGEFVDENSDDVFDVTRTILENGGRADLSAADAFNAMHKISDARHITRKLLNDSVLILPTCGGTFNRKQVRDNPIETNSLMGLYTNHCNLCDLQAIAIPGVYHNDKLPFGITLFTLPAQKDMLIHLAKLFAQCNDK